MIEISIDVETGVVSVEPQGPLEKSDFDRLDEMVDPIIAGGGRLTGLLIHAKGFPGWGDLAGFLSHCRFVKQHHDRISKIALVTDSALGGVAESAARVLHFANVRHFSYADMASAQEWLQAAD